MLPDSTNRLPFRYGVAVLGVGIPPEALDRVFEPFTQLHGKTLGGASGGLGLGLAVARSLAELHEGSLEATSKRADMGTQFTLTLPLETPSAFVDANGPDSVRQ